jgi:hypothetical protein
MSLLYSSRGATKDLDVYVVRPAEAATVRAAARTVAEELGLPEDWLNDAAKGFLRNFARGARPDVIPNQTQIDRQSIAATLERTLPGLFQSFLWLFSASNAPSAAALSSFHA